MNARENGSSFARIPTHAVKLHVWGTQISGFSDKEHICQSALLFHVEQSLLLSRCLLVGL
jgi:hypothetical protein